VSSPPKWTSTKAYRYLRTSRRPSASQRPPVVSSRSMRAARNGVGIVAAQLAFMRRDHPQGALWMQWPGRWVRPARTSRPLCSRRQLSSAGWYGNDRAETVAIWPLRTPPTEEDPHLATEEDLDRIWLLARELRRPLDTRESEVLYLMVPWGRA
jgi:hypothetical protein